MLVTLKISSVSYRKQECLVVLKREVFLTKKQMKYFTYELKKAIKGFIMSLEDRLFLIVEVLQKNVQSFLTII